MQQVEPQVQGWTSRGNNLNVCLPPALGENCISHIPPVPTDLRLAAACGISRLPVSPENATRGAWSRGVLQLGRAGECLMPEGTKLSPRKLLPLLVIVSVLFFHGYHSPAECHCCTQILAIDNTETDLICKPKSSLSV